MLTCSSRHQEFSSSNRLMILANSNSDIMLQYLFISDRSHSHDFAKQFDDSYTKMSGYVKMLENEIEQRSKLIELLENGQTFYEVQNDDAMVVANVSPDYRGTGPCRSRNCL